MLDSVVIEGLKGVGKVELTFDPAHRVRVLFGVNGVGKTKTLEAMYLGLLVGHRMFFDEFKDHSFDANKGIPAGRLFIDGTLHLEQVSSTPDWQTVRQVGFVDTKHERPVVLIGAGGRSSVGMKPAAVGILGDYAERRSAHFRKLLDEINSGSLRSAGMTGDVRAWFVQRAQSVNPYQIEKDNLRGEIDSVLRLLSDLDSRVDASDMRIDGSQRVYLTIEGRQVELAQLSSGFASIVKLFQAIISGYSNFTNSKDLRNLPGIVLIDEIESHLHVSWQTSIIKRLKALFPNTMFVIATHSPLVLTQLEQGEAYLLERKEDGVVHGTEIDSPNMKAFADVLEETFGVDLNALKREALAHEDQTAVKKALLDLLQSRRPSDRTGGAQ